jgi:hypothetical protein
MLDETKECNEEKERERGSERGESEQTLSGVSKCKSQLTDSKSQPFD